MKKLHSFAFYALVTPVITLGAGSVLAQPSSDYENDREQQSTQRDKDVEPSAHSATQSDQSTPRARQSDSQTAADGRNTRDQSRTEHQSYIASVPANGMQSSGLIGAEVKTAGDKDLGSVSDLIIDENGQVVAIVVGVGGFLGLGQKDVAIGWDDVTRSGTSDEQELRISATREDLRSAPEFAMQD